MALPGIVAEAMKRLLPNWPSTPGIVAVSGGADSVALLAALNTFRPPGQLVVAHLNHQLRGLESDADERFVRELAEKWQFPCRVLRVDIARAATGENLEAFARDARYRWFGELATDVGAGWIATGHHADDQAETLLHRLIRGTGLQGLRGIAPIRRDGVVPIVRPLLTVTKQQILTYLADVGQPYRTDTSNADPRFTRNRIRHELLPLLQSFNADVVEALSRTALQAEELFAEQQHEGERLLKLVELPTVGGLMILDAVRLDTLAEPAVRLLCRSLWARERWPTSAMTFAHWDRLAKIAKNLSRAADFPGGIHVRRTDGRLLIRR